MASPSFTVKAFSALSDEATIKLMGEEFSNELAYLQKANTTPEVQKHSTPNDNFTTPSKQLYQEDFVEVNRTLIGILALKWILADDHQSFIQSQPPPVALKRESFTEFRNLCLEQFKDSEEGTGDVFPLLVAIVINDLGKSIGFTDEVEEKLSRQMENANHDEIVYIAAEQGMVPCLQRLDKKVRDDVLLGLKLGATFNIAQFAQAENVPGSLKGAEVMVGHKDAFSLKFLEILFDVAGASANLDARGAKTMIEPVFRNYMMVHKVLIDVVDKKGTYRQNYDHLLEAHGKLLEDKGFRRLSVGDRSERALLRLLVMGRSSTNKAQADLFARAFEGLSASEKEALTRGLNVDGTDDGVAIIPYYMPALFSEGLKHAPAGDEGKVAALASLMRLLGRVYSNPDPVSGQHKKLEKPKKSEQSKKQEQPQRSQQSGGIKERNLRNVADIIHGDGFKADPHILDQLYPIDQSVWQEFLSLRPFVNIWRAGKQRLMKK